ncbi:MAG: hypothetical protein ACIAXF_10450 [Phycisphaerales bacterium JB063]
MTQRKTTWALGGGACLSLAMLATAVGQDDGAEADAPGVAVEVVGDVVVEAEDVAVFMVQDDEEAFRQQIIKELMQEGVPIEDIEMMFGDSVELGSAINTDNAVVREAPDGSALYLPMGATQSYELVPDTTLELPFVADGPGMLTVAYSGATTTSVEIIDVHGRQLDWDSNRRFEGGASPVRHALIPIGQAGEYTVRLGVLSGGELVLGGEWIPFPQVEGVRARVIPRPMPENELVLVPDRMLTGEIDQADADQYYLWCRFEATADGQLVVLANADRGDITMSSFNLNDYQRPIETVDSDMNGSVANEGIIVDAVAGQTYYVRVEMRSGERCEVEVRSGWIPAPE